MYFLIMAKTKRNSDEFIFSDPVGYFETYEEVVKILHSNHCNLIETCYDYAVVEQIPPGLYPSLKEAIFFKYDSEKNGYFEIKKI